MRKKSAEVERLFREHLGAMHPDEKSTSGEVAEHLSFLLESAMSRAGLDGNDARLHSA